MGLLYNDDSNGGNIASGYYLSFWVPTSQGATSEESRKARWPFLWGTREEISSYILSVDLQSLLLEESSATTLLNC